MSDQMIPGTVISGGGQSSQPPLDDRQDKTPVSTAAHSHSGLIIALLLVLIVAGGGGWLLTHRSKPVTPVKQSGKVTPFDTEQPVAVQVNELQLEGKSSEAIQKLSTQIAATSNGSQKGPLYELEAETYLDQSDCKDALVAAKAAESQTPTANSAELIAKSEAGLGDKTSAAKEYQTAATRYQKSGDLSSMQDMQNAAKALGGS